MSYEEKYGRGSGNYAGSRPFGSSRDHSAAAAVSRKRRFGSMSAGFEGALEQSVQRQKVNPFIGPIDTRSGTQCLPIVTLKKPLVRSTLSVE